MSTREFRPTLHRFAAMRLVAALAASGAITDARAEVRCIDSDIQVTATFDAALASANTIEEIRIKTGNFIFNFGSIGYSGTVQGNNKTLTISGGWNGPPGQCNSRDGDPASTVFWGNGERRVLALTASSTFTGTVNVENMSIGGGYATEPSGPSCLRLSEQTGGLMAIRIDRVRFEGCVTQPGIDATAVTLVSSSALMVRNSLFAGNDAGTGIPVGTVVRGGLGYVLNNTFADNVSAQPDGHAGINASGSDGGSMTLANNLFDRNVATASQRRDIRAASNVTLRNNRYTGLGGFPVEETGSSSGPAGFIANEYALAATSSARDAGESFAPILQGSVDLANQLRVQRGVVDLGALEFSSVFDDGFE